MLWGERWGEGDRENRKEWQLNPLPPNHLGSGQERMRLLKTEHEEGRWWPSQSPGFSLQTLSCPVIYTPKYFTCSHSSSCAKALLVDAFFTLFPKAQSWGPLKDEVSHIFQ